MKDDDTIVVALGESAREIRAKIEISMNLALSCFRFDYEEGLREAIRKGLSRAAS